MKIMTPQYIGLLHPGDMGISVAASAQHSGHQVYWASAGRSAATRNRAGKYGLHDLETVEALCSECSVILSVCPPDAAEAIARQVVAAGFKGLYLDANAISPQQARQIGTLFTEAGIAFVDGSIIGGPAWQPNATWLYLSGPHAAEVAGYFSAGPLMTRVLGETIGSASALKMCFAAYTKGSTALLCAVMATAANLGVAEALREQWARDDPAFPAQAEQRVRSVTAKAWRFVGEMDEIAATFEAAGLPRGFHNAAAEVYRALAQFKDAANTPELVKVLDALSVR